MKHPNHTKRQKYHDIALLKVETVNFWYAVWPACLPQQNEFLEVPLLIAGFGRTSVTSKFVFPDKSSLEKKIFLFIFVGNLQSEILMKSSLEEIPLEECRHNYTKILGDLKGQKLENGITGSLLCAKNRTHHTDGCQGLICFYLYYFLN